LVFIGFAITFVAGPLYGYAERAASDLLAQEPYVEAVLNPGAR